MKSRPLKWKSTALLEKDDILEILNDDFGDGQPALIKACQALNLKLIKKLIYLGVDIDKPGCNGNTALMETIASSYGGRFSENRKLTIVKELLKARANVHLESEEGYTALFLAACEGYLTIVNALIAEGANLNHKSRTGETVLIRTLHNALILGFRTVKEQKRLNLEKIVDMGLANGADLNYQNSAGDTILIYAARLGHFEIIKKLLVAKVDYKLKNNKGDDFYDCLKVKEIIDWVEENYKEYEEARIIKENSRKFGI